MADGYNFGQAGTLSADEFSQQQQLNRQQQLANLLMTQGQKQPQGQMVGNRFVPSSFFQNITPLVQTALGSYMGNKADTEAAKLAQTIRQNKGDVEQQIINRMTPQPEMPKEMAGPYGVSGSGQNVPMPVGVLPAKEADYAGALKMIQMNPYGAGKEYVPTILKQLTPEPTPEEKRFKSAVADGSWNPQKQGGLNSFLNQMTDKDKASLELDKARLKNENARLGIAQQQLAYDTGIGMPNVGGGQASGQGGQGGQFAPASLPQYQYNPILSPKQNQEAAGKFAETAQKNVTNAKDSFDLMKSASNVLASDVASSGRLSSIGTGIGEFFGADSKASQADAQLNMLSGALTMKQPRFEGPQGVLDVTLYQKLAGDLGNPNIPIPSRLATMQQMIDLQKKYYPNGDWDSIKTKLDGSGKVSVGAPAKVVNFNDLK